ncbi:putative threonine efflux protein [uncultured Sporomusa sp.]|uniref:Putative threonine efflux protein n=1 Tax=uncultured Sporomusa sp. TaxID=307249 RepID=A0A212M145_9FIRM|nr:LysE family translocator [uncultured Sporomusa sp.]SCM83522.1 putative threonine efflux protein [uncultured Sporomusa sp.]
MPFSFAELYAYVGIVALLVVIPGPNTVLVMQSVGISGQRAGLFNVFGIVTAVYLNALLSGLGLTLIIMQSAEIYNLIKMLGAAYIAYLGVTSLVNAYKLHRKKESTCTNNSSSQAPDVVTQESSFTFYSKGVLTGVLNPKSALFFLAFFPQFIHPGGNIVIQSLILTILYSLVSVTWYGLLVIFMGKLRHFLVRSETQKWLKAITGTILVGLGIRIALQR